MEKDREAWGHPEKCGQSAVFPQIPFLTYCFSLHIITNGVFSREKESPKRGGKQMEIRVGENESLESALKRFKRKCARSGVLAEVRRREHYEKPSVKRKKKAEAARKRKY